VRPDVSSTASGASPTASGPAQPQAPSDEPPREAGPGGDGAGASDHARHVRGSSLLLSGRFVAVGLGFLAQIVLVRALTKGDYGAFAYALAVVSMGSSVAAFGLDKAMSRFVPMYEERGETARAVGAVVLSLVLVAAVSVAVIGVLLLVGDQLTGTVDPLALGLLAILVFLVPVQAFDALVTALFAVLASPMAIFVRRHLMAPGLQLLVLAIAIPAGLGVAAIAAGYLIVGVFGVVIYGLLLYRLMRRRWGPSIRRRPTIPGREVLGFSVPLLSSDLVFVLRGSVVVILLEWYGSTLDVAAFRAVFPQARLILVVLATFTYLFLPAAARLVERNDLPGLGRLYWHGMAWVALFSFPLFAASFALAEPISVLLYGSAYADSAPVLAVLALGFFGSAVLGMSGQVLRALGRVRVIVAIDVGTAIASVAAYLLLIPVMGALGAAIGTAITLLLQGFAYQVAVLRAGVPGPKLQEVVLYPSLAAIGLLLLGIQLFLAPPVWLGLPLVALAGLFSLWLHRHQLELDTTFPELLRIPFMRRLLARPSRGGSLP
jgi:O-antigen/teichoic acid export membrane protein